MNIHFSVRLPVDAQSVPLVRGLLRQALEHLRVHGDRIDEIVLALTEACANVVHHASDHDEYRVDVTIDDRMCRIRVTDNGQGFDPAAVEAAMPASPLDGGRGLVLMRALVDRLAFVVEQDGGHSVILEKLLVADEPDLRLIPN